MGTQLGKDLEKNNEIFKKTKSRGRSINLRLVETQF